MNRLAIFDVDGTLCDTTGVDDECYRDAVASVLAVAPDVVNWSGAAHVTDAGILDWLWSAHRAGEPTLADVARARSEFVHRLNSALRAAPSRFEIDDAVLACADDARSRVEIVQLARRRAEIVHGCRFDRVVSVGDGTWDVATAAALSLPFIGIATGERAERLRQAGATTVLADFSDAAEVERALATAEPPLP